jgi:DNA polymerase-3 subunit gamma/tau
LEDVIELDAASNNGVDEIRDIRDKSTYAPSRAKYKVYIIDEVHMLTTGAFNALLKTLEEPTENVVFVLATTEIQKSLRRFYLAYSVLLSVPLRAMTSPSIYQKF